MNNYSILVVDDQAENFDVIQALLQNIDYSLHYANHGKTAIDSLDKFDPDLILLDVMMPEIDGIEVCKQIKSNPRWQAVPIIMVTSLSSTDNLARCLNAGADDFISKPINGIELRARVHSMLRIKKQHDRIESLSRLQRNNINSLKSSLHDLNSDLAIGFPKESDAPLYNVLDKTQLLLQDFHKMPLAKIKEILLSINQSAIELDQFQQSFLFTRQLSQSLPDSDKQRSCLTRISIEQIVIKRVEKSQVLPKLIFDIEDVELAVLPKHLQDIITEFIDYILKLSNSSNSINIYGHTMNDEFHFYIDNRGVNIKDIPLTELSTSIRFNPVSNTDHDLSIGLKIAKKIVEIHEGLFLISNITPTEATIYITLPLVTNVARELHPPVSSNDNNSNSISDEVQITLPCVC